MNYRRILTKKTCSLSFPKTNGRPEIQADRQKINKPTSQIIKKIVRWRIGRIKIILFGLTIT